MNKPYNCGYESYNENYYIECDADYSLSYSILYNVYGAMMNRSTLVSGTFVFVSTNINSIDTPLKRLWAYQAYMYRGFFHLVVVAKVSTIHTLNKDTCN